MSLPPKPWQGILEATTKNIVCPQKLNNQIGENYKMQLDCLHMNIFVPYKYSNDEKLPVVLYIHGGAFQQGYGNELSHNNLVTRGIIMVNINYRVGVHGFLCLGTEFAPGNAGLKDQVAALQWVQRNIKKFGGDPNNLSINGNSAGSGSVEFLILSKMSSGLFKKAVSESFSALSSWAVFQDPIKLAKDYAKLFGVDTSKNISNIEEFYKNLTEEDFKLPFKSDRIDILGFMPCIEKNIGDDTFLHVTPREIIKSGDYNKIDYVTGFTSMEGIHLLDMYEEIKNDMIDNFFKYLPTDLEFQKIEDKEETIRKVKDFYFPDGVVSHNGYVDFWTDTIFAYGIISSSKLHTENKLSVYLYQFSFNGSVRLPNPANPLIRGPGHVTQAMYIHNFSYGIGYDVMSPSDYKIQESMRTLCYNFFKYGYDICFYLCLY